LFSYISINWAGKPMKTLEMMLGYIRGTTTVTGLKPIFDSAMMQRLL